MLSCKMQTLICVLLFFLFECSALIYLYSLIIRLNYHLVSRHSFYLNGWIKQKLEVWKPNLTQPSKEHKDVVQDILCHLRTQCQCFCDICFHVPGFLAVLYNAGLIIVMNLESESQFWTVKCKKQGFPCISLILKVVLHVWYTCHIFLKQHSTSNKTQKK